MHLFYSARHRSPLKRTMWEGVTGLHAALHWRPNPHPQTWGMGGVDEVSDHPSRPFRIVHEVLLHGFQGDELIKDGMLGPPGNRHQLARADAPSHGRHQWQTGAAYQVPISSSFSTALMLKLRVE